MLLTVPDTHCHLAHKRLKGDLNGVLARTKAAGVTPLLNVGIDLETSRRVVAQHQDHPWCHPAVGVHPHHAKDLAPHTPEAAELRELAALPQCLAVGESGLDFHYNFSPRKAQSIAFAWHAKLALELAKPLVVHSREAFAETHALLVEMPGLTGVIHCFSEGVAEADAFLELGLYLSFAGQVTWTGQERLKAAAKHCPADRLLVETDAPFLAPEPVRGKRCEPGFTIHTLNFLADLRGVDPTELASQVLANSRRLFGPALA